LQPDLNGALFKIFWFSPLGELVRKNFKKAGVEGGKAAQINNI